MERIANQRRTHNKYHLSLGHARAQLIDHLLSDDVSLGNGNLVNTWEVHVADVATGHQGRHQGKKKAVSYEVFHKAVFGSICNNPSISRDIVVSNLLPYKAPLRFEILRNRGRLLSSVSGSRHNTLLPEAVKQAIVCSLQTLIPIIES